MQLIIGVLVLLLDIVSLYMDSSLTVVMEHLVQRYTLYIGTAYVCFAPLDYLEIFLGCGRSGLVINHKPCDRTSRHTFQHRFYLRRLGDHLYFRVPQEYCPAFGAGTTPREIRGSPICREARGQKLHPLQLPFCDI